MRRALPLLSLFLLSLSACAPQLDRVAAASAPAAKPAWAFEKSDVPLDPAWRFGRLDNGMRFAIRRNATPAGTAMVRMDVAAGSLDELPHERGFAHFVEHMAFNGSTNVPEGEMVRLLERKGLAFGADTNASTSFENTTYMLDLPRNDPALLDTALMLMRETASELTISPEAVERERGVVLAEMRDRNTFGLRNVMDQARFLYPGAHYPERFPIGTAETVGAATADTLRAFWQREYVPEQATVIVVGDFDEATMEQAIRARFSDWRGAAPEPQPDAGPVDPKARAMVDIHLDPALSERIVASRHGPWLDEPDTLAQRQENLLRQVGYAIVNRRLVRIARLADPPFRGAGYGTGGVFRAARTTNLVVDTVDGKWRRGLSAAAIEYRRALAQGFTAAEVAEQVAAIRTATEDAAGSADTRPNAALVNAVFALLRDDVVPSTPQSVLQRFEAFAPEITPDRVLAALRREAVPLDDPLIRFQGRRDPAGGADAIRAAWDEAMRAPLPKEAAAATAGFAYTDFGAPGAVASDEREPALGIRRVRFANGVMLNLKRTEIERDRVQVRLTLDGGDMLNTRENPLATQMVPNLPTGGLGRHSQDELQTILAGRTVGTNLSTTPDAFVSSTTTTPRDLELQLQLMAAFLTDPGFRPEGEVQYRLGINNFFAQMRATPFSALSNALGGILSDNDPRFTLQAVEDYRRLTFAKLREDLRGPLGGGAIEIALVGDIDEERAIALVARTLGALPARAGEFGARAGQQPRSFTADRSRRVIRHTGPADQALLRLTWPTRDDSDAVETLKLALLERVVRIELTDTIREKLGKAYNPSAASSPSRVWPGYGTFGVAASVAVGEVDATRAAIAETLAELRDRPVSDDILSRARQPLLESYDNALKSNGGWMALVDRAQSEPGDIARYVEGKARLMALTAADVQDVARRYLAMDRAVEVLVLPEPAPAVTPAPAAGS